MTAISCDLHDYFEIVCMRQSKVKIDVLGQKHVGVALDIVVKDNGESLLLDVSGTQKLIALGDIDKLESTGNTVEAHNFVVQIK